MPLHWPPIVALLLSILLVGCGQKGPLYLPDAPLERETHTHSSAGASPLIEKAENVEKAEEETAPLNTDQIEPEASEE